MTKIKRQDFTSHPVEIIGWVGLLKCFNFYGPIFSDNGKNILKTNETVYQTDFISDHANRRYGLLLSQSIAITPSR
jgi:hypothetical protein